MTFRTLEGADGEGVRFESVKYPGYYLVFQEGRPVLVLDPAKEEASFYVSTDESVPDHADDSAGNSQREVVKTVRFYTVGETVGTDDIRIQMYLNNGTWKRIMDYETNADKIDMSTAGQKLLEVRYEYQGRKYESVIRLDVVEADYRSQ